MLYPDRNLSLFDNGPRKNSISRGSVYRYRFAGHGSLIDQRLPALYSPVKGDNIAHPDNDTVTRNDISGIG